MSKHEHGTMDTSVQEKTFAGFVTFTIRTVIIIFIVLILLALFRT